MNSLKLMELTSKLDDLLERLEELDEDRLEDTFELDSLKDQAESLKSEADDLDFEAITLDVDDYDDDESSEELEDWVSRLEDLEWEVGNLESDVSTFMLCLDWDSYNSPEGEKKPAETRRNTMRNIVRSEKTFFDGYYHYDASGKKVAESRISLLGYNTFDMSGNKIGRSDKNALDGYNHYDASGTKIGYSIGGGAPHLYTNYDASDKKIGHSRFDGIYVYKHSYISGSSGSPSGSTEGCYVATCVYGSYDCPEVWILRRFRDDFLGKSVLGRSFIRTYYAVSPTIVRWFGGFEAFRSFWKKPLDKMVRELSRKGVEDTPYEDKNWR